MKKRDTPPEMLGSITAYIKLIRPYGILFLGFTPVFSALGNGEFNGVHLGILLFIGVLLHVFTFVQNDYYDVAVDQRSPHVANRPLTTGVITPNHAAFLFFGAFCIALLLTILFLFSWGSLWFFLLSFFLMTLYNKYSKRIPGMEYVLGLGVFTFGIFGALTVASTISPLAILISSVGFLQWVFSVGISANLKDVASDAELGVRTTPMLLGVTSQANAFIKPRRFLVYAYGIKLIHLFVAALPFFFGYVSPFIHGFPIPLFCFLITCGILFMTATGILTTPLTRRDTMLRYEGAHEGLALLLLPFVLLSVLLDHFGMIITISLFLLLVLWPLFILRLLFGPRLIPME